MTTDHDHPVDPARVAAARARLIDTEEAGRLAGLLGLLADPTRARILYALDLVDELCLTTSPFAAGAALPVLGADAPPRAMRLESLLSDDRSALYARWRRAR